MFFECNTSKDIETEFLFNSKTYLQQSGKNVYTAQASIGSEYLLCQLTEIEDAVYVSGYRATFGGIEGSAIIVLDNFIKTILNELRHRNAKSLLIRQAPSLYDSSFAEACQDVLLEHGFRLQSSDINQHIVVDGIFEDKIDIQERKKLRRLREAGLTCKLYDRVEGDEWFDLLSRAREHKNFPLTLSKEAYYNLSKELPEIYTYAGVFLNERLVANAVFVKISENAIYYFVPASDPEYNYLSPAVLILESMYQLAMDQHCSIVDLGISSVDGILNQGLYKFKKNMGAIDSQKNIYKYTFD